MAKPRLTASAAHALKCTPKLPLNYKCQIPVEKHLRFSAIRSSALKMIKGKISRLITRNDLLPFLYHSLARLFHFVSLEGVRESFNVGARHSAHGLNFTRSFNARPAVEYFKFETVFDSNAHAGAFCVGEEGFSLEVD